MNAAKAYDVIYLDNILLLDQDRIKLIEHTEITLLLLECLGFPSELPQVSPGAYTETDFHRLHNKFNKKGAEPPSRKKWRQ